VNDEWTIPLKRMAYYIFAHHSDPEVVKENLNIFHEWRCLYVVICDSNASETEWEAACLDITVVIGSVLESWFDFDWKSPIQRIEIKWFYRKVYILLWHGIKRLKPSMSSWEDLSKEAYALISKRLPDKCLQVAAAYFRLDVARPEKLYMNESKRLKFYIELCNAKKATSCYRS
jgi:hypothetical protein